MKRTNNYLHVSTVKVRDGVAMFLLSILLLAIIANPLFAFAQETAAGPFAVQKGVSIGGWISQASTRMGPQDKFFTEQHVQQLAQLGFDHIRLPVDEKELFDEQGEWNTHTRDLIHQAIEWCQKAGLKVVLDLHILRSHYFNNEKDIALWKDKREQDKLVAMWKKMAAEYHRYPNELLAFELLNEVVAPEAKPWNELSARLISELRKTEPKRTLIYGSHRHNAVGSLPDLAVPANDPHIMLSFHFYTPFMLTHYRAPWTGLKNLEIPIRYPGQLLDQRDIDGLADDQHKRIARYYNDVYDKKELKKRLQVAIDKAKKSGVKLYCAEFGCIDFTDRQVKRNWFKDITAIFRENDIAGAVWGYRANFGIFNNDGEVKDQEVIDILTK